MSRGARDSIYYVKQQHFDDMETGLNALKSQCKMLKGLVKEYPSAMFLMGLSNHNGKHARKVNENKGKVGRPKVGFVAKRNAKGRDETGPHIHLYIFGRYAATVGTEFVHRQNKNYQQREHRRHVSHNAFMLERSSSLRLPLDYVRQQSTNLRYSDRRAVEAAFAGEREAMHKEETSTEYRRRNNRGERRRRNRTY